MLELRIYNQWEDKVFYLIPTMGIDLKNKEFGIGFFCFLIHIRIK